MDLLISNLSKTYEGNIQALNKVNLTISKGMFGLLGPNGAGKSTLMRIIATLQEPDSGSITLGDIDVLRQKQEVKKILGYLPQEFGLYPKVSAEEMLMHFASLKGIENRNKRKETVKALLFQTNLYSARKQYLGSFSGGMKQRFGIAQALLGNPKLIIVDEPTAGLDPEERVRFHNLLSEIGENIIIILSTHIVDDVSDLCSRMAIINEGNVLLSENPQMAIKELKGKVWKKLIAKEKLSEHKKSFNVISTKLYLGKILIRVLGDSLPDDSFSQVEPDIEDIYFSVIHDSVKVISKEA